MRVRPSRETHCRRMLEPRLYRVAFVPVLLALLVAAFSLQDRPRPIGTTQAPEAFDEIRADQTLDDLARRFPVRRPGDAADTRLAGEIATRLRQTVPGHRGGAPLPGRHDRRRARSHQRRRHAAGRARARRSSSWPIAMPQSPAPRPSCRRPPRCWSSRASPPTAGCAGPSPSSRPRAAAGASRARRRRRGGSTALPRRRGPRPRRGRRRERRGGRSSCRSPTAAGRRRSSSSARCRPRCAPRSAPTPAHRAP